MRSLFQHTTRTLLFAVLLIIALAATTKAQEAKIQMSHLDHLAAKASETIDVNVDERLIQFATKVFNDRDIDEAKIKKFVSGLKGIYVKSFEFDDDNVFSSADIDTIRNQMREPAWNRMVNVKSRRDNNIEVYISLSGGNINGLTVISTEPRELTIVNIVGPVDLEKLAELEGHLGIPDLGIGSSKTKKKNDDDQ